MKQAVYENGSLLSEAEEMKRVFAELRATKFSFPSGWGSLGRSVAGAMESGRNYDTAHEVLELQDVQDAGDIAAAANQPTQRRYTCRTPK